MVENVRAYPDELMVKDALQHYFSKYHFENGGYDWKYFKIKVGPVFIPVPNTPARVRAVKVHDVHHVLTEYPATLKGEAQIGAWEIASGCGKYYVAWGLNFGSFIYGLIFFFPAVLKAFLAGRRSDNFYHGTVYETLLGRSVGDLRMETCIGAKRKNIAIDYVAFLLYVILVLIVVTGAPLILYLTTKYLIGLWS